MTGKQKKGSAGETAKLRRKIKALNKEIEQCKAKTAAVKQRCESIEFELRKITSCFTRAIYIASKAGKQ